MTWRSLPLIVLCPRARGFGDEAANFAFGPSYMIKVNARDNCRRLDAMVSKACIDPGEYHVNVLRPATTTLSPFRFPSRFDLDASSFAWVQPARRRLHGNEIC